MADRKVTTRRTALIGLSALGVNGFPSAQAAPAPHPDAELFTLFAQFEQAREADTAAQRALMTGPRRTFMYAAALATERALEAADAVSACQARTIDGMRLKVRVAVWHHGDMAALERAEETGALASIARDLLAMA